MQQTLSYVSKTVKEALTNAAFHLHTAALYSRRRQILDIASLRLRFTAAEIYSSYIIAQIFQIAWAESDIVADKEGGCGESWHDFDTHDAALLVEEDVVAVASFVEVAHEVVDGDLYVVGYRVYRGACRWHDVEFAEADARAGSDVEVDAIFFVDGQSLEFYGIEGQVFVECVKADDLHVGMAQCTAGERTEVLEEDDCFIVAGVLHFLPVMHAEANEAVHVICGVVRHVRVTDLAFDEDELVGVFDDVVFVLEQDEVTVCIDDAREFLAVAEGAGGGLVDDVFRLLLAERRIETDEIDFHREDTSSIVTKST